MNHSSPIYLLCFILGGLSVFLKIICDSHQRKEPLATSAWKIIAGCSVGVLAAFFSAIQWPNIPELAMAGISFFAAGYVPDMGTVMKDLYQLLTIFKDSRFPGITIFKNETHYHVDYHDEDTSQRGES